MLNTLKSAALALACALAASVAFANTTTTNYSLNKPSVGADADNWGTLSNANWDSLDSIVFGIQGTANAACPKAGCTFTGGISGTTASFSSTTAFTGLATFNGGITDNGALSVGGPTTISGSLNAVNNFVVGGTAIFGNGLGSNTFAAFLSGSTPVYGLTGAISIQANSGTLNLWNGANNASFGSNGVFGVPGLAVTGSVSLPAGSVTGTMIANGAITGSNISANTVANSNLVSMAPNTIKGNNTGSSAAPADLTATQVVGLLGLLSSSAASGPGSLTIPTNNGNLYVNFGKMTLVGANSDSVPLTYASSYSSWWIAVCSGAGGGPGSVASGGATSTTIKCHNNVSSPQDVNWIVIGQ